MPEAMRQYVVLDLKSFFASAECADRHLDPLTTNLVVADASRTDKTICLAVSPALKSFGVPGRPRLFEVKQRVAEINALRLSQAIRAGRAKRTADGSFSFLGESPDTLSLAAEPGLALSYHVAPPRMALYLERSAQIYSLYLRYVAPEDIHPYSIDEVFLDVTDYLATYRQTARELVTRIVREILATYGITAAAGIGTNLYLAKIAADILAKHVPADADGVRIAELTEESYRRLLWTHRPLTDFWRIGRATQKRLHSHYLYTMGDIARASLTDTEWFYKAFGIDAELLLDHAWGLEPCTLSDIKAYRPQSSSLCEGQVLTEPYPYERARIIVQEMADNLALQLAGKGLITDLLTLDISYDRINVDDGSYQGELHLDHYGRRLPAPAHGSVRLPVGSNLSSQLISAFTGLFDRIVDQSLFIRKLSLSAGHVLPDEGLVQYDLFTNTQKLEKEKRLQSALLQIKERYGKNAVLRGTNFQEGATQRSRNGQIGGHKA